MHCSEIYYHLLTVSEKDTIIYTGLTKKYRHRSRSSEQTAFPERSLFPETGQSGGKAQYPDLRYPSRIPEVFRYDSACWLRENAKKTASHDHPQIVKSGLLIEGLELVAGFEPATCWLRISCTATVLHQQRKHITKRTLSILLFNCLFNFPAWYFPWNVL